MKCFQEHRFLLTGSDITRSTSNKIYRLHVNISLYNEVGTVLTSKKTCHAKTRPSFLNGWKLQNFQTSAKKVDLSGDFSACPLVKFCFTSNVMIRIDSISSFGQPPFQFYFSDKMFTCPGQAGQSVISIPEFVSTLTEESHLSKWRSQVKFFSPCLTKRRTGGAN